MLFMWLLFSVPKAKTLHRQHLYLDSREGMGNRGKQIILILKNAESECEREREREKVFPPFHK